MVCGKMIDNVSILKFKQMSRFSAMSTDEKNSAMAEWQKRWNNFILNQHNNYYCWDLSRLYCIETKHTIRSSLSKYSAL
jgi:hypothetical protein